MRADTKRQILLNRDISASIADVWTAWTTNAGCRSFFAPDCKVELWIGGAYEMYFLLDNEPGQRGGEGCTILAMQREKMLSFTWNAPPEMPDMRAQFTHVFLYFAALDTSTTKVTLMHDGWGVGEQWDKVFLYFQRAWGEVVLPRLAYRFAVGPVDWSNPNAFRDKIAAP